MRSIYDRTHFHGSTLQDVFKNDVSILCYFLLRFTQYKAVSKTNTVTLCLYDILHKKCSIVLDSVIDDVTWCYGFFLCIFRKALNFLIRL